MSNALSNEEFEHMLSLEGHVPYIATSSEEIPVRYSKTYNRISRRADFFHKKAEASSGKRKTHYENVAWKLSDRACDHAGDIGEYHDEMRAQAFHARRFMGFE